MRIRDKITALSANNRIILTNVTGAFLVKGLSLIVSLLTTPAYIRFFNNESALGIWFTILSVLSWILNFDLGIGNGLRNHLASAYAKNETEEANKYVSSAYISIGILCIVVSIVFAFVFQYINWNTVFNIDTNIISAEAMLKAAEVVFIGIMLQLFFKIISSVLYAIQKSSINNLLNLMTSILILVMVSVMPSGSNDYNVVFMAYVHAIAVLIPLIVTSVIVFVSPKTKCLSPSLKNVCREHTKKVISLGGTFFLVQVLYMLIMSTNEYLITLLSKSSDVVPYRVYNQIFTFGSTVFALALTPIWSAITKAIAENEISWIKKLYKKLLLIAFIVSGAEFFAIPILQPVLNIWLGQDSFTVDYLTAISFAFFGSAMVFNSVLSSVANGTGHLKTQFVSFAVGSAVKFPLSWILVKLTGSWVGVVMATTIAMLIYCILQPPKIHLYFQEVTKCHKT